MTQPAVFLDRDGVVIRDVDLLTRPEQVELFPETPAALRDLQAAGYRLVVVTNQSVVARGMCTEAEVGVVHDHIAARLRAEGVSIAGFYFCPHHPHANLPQYRVLCDCRKPRPGLLLQAARDLDLDLAASCLVGDKISDVAAGQRAGCRLSIYVQTGKHLLNEPIVSPDSVAEVVPDLTCGGLAEAAAAILASARSGR